VSWWAEQYGLAAVDTERHLARGAIPSEALERLIARGHTIAEIAVAVERSKTTVRYWMKRYGLRTLNRSVGTTGIHGRLSSTISTTLTSFW
jgi:hypothetical protein